MQSDPFPLSPLSESYSHPLDISPHFSINTDSASSPIVQQFKQTMPSLSPFFAEKKPLKGEVIPKGDELDISPEVLSQTTQQTNLLKSQVKHVEKNLKRIKSRAESSTSTETTLMIVQMWIADVVLKGGAAMAQSSIPFVLSTTSEALPILNPVTEGIKVATDFVDIASGLTGSIYRARMLDMAENELKRLKRHSQDLTPEQFARLEQLEKSVKHAQSLLPSQVKEQIIRMTRNAFSYLTFALFWFRDIQVIASITSGIYSIIGGLNAAIYGLFLYRAHQELKAHRSWSADFKAWVKEHTITINEQKGVNSNAIAEQLTKVKQKIANRLQAPSKKVHLLKEKIANKEIDVNTIRTKVKEVQQEGLQRFVERLNTKEMPLKEFQTSLEQKLGVSFKTQEELNTVESFYKKVREFGIIQRDPLSENKKERLEATRHSMIAELNACCEIKMATFITPSDDPLVSIEPLLTAYVDYQSILDKTIKSSLIEMVEKKHKIEKVFLKFKRVQLGTQFTVATIIFGVSLTLAIIGLALTPVGFAGLILGLLAGISFVISLALVARGYQLAYQQKPGLTAATLKGAYIRLYSYYALAKIETLTDKLGISLEKIWRTNRNRLANAIDQLPTVHRCFSRPLQVEEEIEMEDFSKARKEKELDGSEAKTWKDKADALQKELEELTWKDFAKKAQLKVASPQTNSISEEFDSLEALNQALKQADFNLLSRKTKTLLEKQLGINIQALQAEMEKDPSTFKQLLRNFFNLDDIGFVKFVGEQKFRDEGLTDLP